MATEPTKIGFAKLDVRWMTIDTESIKLSEEGREGGKRMAKR